MSFEVAAIGGGADKAEVAKQLGAHHYIHSKAADPGEVLKELGGAALIVNTASTSSAAAPALAGMKPGGTLTLFRTGATRAREWRLDQHARMERMVCDAGETPLSPGGMLNLSLQSDRSGGLALLYGASGGGGPVWDSRRLGPGDTYACKPLRPGAYAVANSLGPAKASVRVTYPDPQTAAAGARLASGPAPIRVGQTMDPGEQTIDPGQVLVLAIETTAQLTMVLESPDEGPRQTFADLAHALRRYVPSPTR
jgi:hypothetical protein